jgi:hypothetical protein
MAIFPQTQIPATISGAVFWYDAFKQAQGLVSSWSNQILPTPATQGTTTNQPNNTAATINGKPALLFDGVNDLILASATNANADIFANGGTIAMVFKPIGDSTGTAGRLFEKTVANGGYFCTHGLRNLGFIANFTISGGVWATPSNSVINGNNYFFIITYDNSSIANNPNIYLNSTSPITLTKSTTPSGVRLSDASSSLMIGNRIDSARCFNGAIAEIMGFKKILSASEISQLINYFKNKYGFA